MSLSGLVLVYVFLSRRMRSSDQIMVVAANQLTVILILGFRRGSKEMPKHSNLDN